MACGWMPLYVGDYLADTQHLDCAESGAYMHLIMHYWQHGGLPKTDEKLASIARAMPEQWQKIKPVVREFFGPNWSHKRVEEERKKSIEAHERRVKSGSKGGLAKASNARAMLAQDCSNASSNAVAMLYQSQSHKEEDRVLNSYSESKTKIESLTKNCSSKLEREFNDFWLAYPKRVAKRAAEKKFETVVKSGVDPPLIIAAAARYAAACRSSGIENQFIKAPDVWLNKGCWTDEDLPSPKHLNGFAAVLRELTEETYEQTAYDSSDNLRTVDLNALEGSKHNRG